MSYQGSSFRFHSVLMTVFGQVFEIRKVLTAKEKQDCYRVRYIVFCEQDTFSPGRK